MTDVPTTLRQAYTNIVLSLSDALSNDQMYKARQDSNLKALEELASLKAHKSTYLTQYQAVKSS